MWDTREIFIGARVMGGFHLFTTILTLEVSRLIGSLQWPSWLSHLPNRLNMLRRFSANMFVPLPIEPRMGTNGN